MSNRLDKEREAELQPKRIVFAVEQLAKVGIEIDYEDDTKIKFMHKGEVVTLFPYSGWHTGTLQQFKDKIKEKHGNNEFAKSYYKWIESVENYKNSLK